MHLGPHFELLSFDPARVLDLHSLVMQNIL